MKKTMISFLLLALLAGTAGAAQINFAESYDSALQAAAKNQDIVITFYADW